MSRTRHRQRGQSSIEMLALLPALAIITLLGWQVVVVGHSWSLAGGAARAGARAHEVGAPADRAARAALPARHARLAAVTWTGPAGERVALRVRLTVPGLLPWLPRLESPAASARPRGGPAAERP